MKTYRIGNFTFDTREEYERAAADVRMIHKITHTVDIYDPDIALRLYQSIRSGKLKIHSKIGKRFFLDLADIVAEDAGKTRKRQKKMQGQLKDLQRQEESRKNRVRRTDRSKKALGAVCFLAAIGCFVWYFWSDFTNLRGNQAVDRLRELREGGGQEAQEEEVELVGNDTFFQEDAPELSAAEAGEGEVVELGEPAETPQVLPEYEMILQENPDIAGWITIEGTKIDYPVMLTKWDGDYYLKRNFNGEDDINGTLFMDARTELAPRSTNIIIYGHNMKSGQMFGSLKSYLDEDYWNAHRQISFDTIYEKGTYEIFAVCRAQVQDRSSDGFRYYDFIQADTEEEFQEFLRNIQQLSVITGTELPSYGDELLTLSTCNNYVEDGRLFLVAKKCRDAE